MCYTRILSPRTKAYLYVRKVFIFIFSDSFSLFLLFFLLILSSIAHASVCHCQIHIYWIRSSTKGFTQCIWLELSEWKLRFNFNCILWCHGFCQNVSIEHFSHAIQMCSLTLISILFSSSSLLLYLLSFHLFFWEAGGVDHLKYRQVNTIYLRYFHNVYHLKLAKFKNSLAPNKTEIQFNWEEKLMFRYIYTSQRTQTLFSVIGTNQKISTEIPRGSSKIANKWGKQRVLKWSEECESDLEKERMNRRNIQQRANCRKVDARKWINFISYGRIIVRRRRQRRQWRRKRRKKNTDTVCLVPNAFISKNDMSKAARRVRCFQIGKDYGTDRGLRKNFLNKNTLVNGVYA